MFSGSLKTNSIVLAKRYKQAMQKVKAAHQAIANHDEVACRNSPKILTHDNTIPDVKAQPKY